MILITGARALCSPLMVGGRGEAGGCCEPDLAWEETAAALTGPARSGHSDPTCGSHHVHNDCYCYTRD